jgi:hypothetical protein
LQGGVVDWAGSTVGELSALSGRNSGQIAILAIVPDKVPYLLGESYLSIPFVFIPSAIWGEKPYAGGRHVAEKIYNRTDTTIPAGAVGEAYWNFSYLGVVIVFIFFGAFLKLVANIYLSNPGNPFVTVFFIYSMILLSPQTEKIYDFVHHIVPLFLIYFLSKYHPAIMKNKKL